MKRVSLFIITLLLITITTPVSALLTNSECISAATGSAYYARGTGATNYTYCYQAQCKSGSWTLVNQRPSASYTCGNKNTDPLVRSVSNGCSAYSGGCSTANVPYCNSIVSVDCSKRSDGSVYEILDPQPVTQPTQAPTQATSPSPSPSPTQRRTNQARPSTPVTPVTEATTTQLSSNNNIKKITIGGRVIDEYEESKDTYTMKIPKNYNKLDVKVELEDSKATYEVKNNKNIPEEGTTIEIIVKAEDGTERKVYFKVTRAEDGENNDCNLNRIFIEGYDIEFTKTTKVYTVTIPNKVNSLELGFEKGYDEQEVIVKGNEKLKNKSKIEITVLAEDQTECFYTINIRKKSNTWKYLILILILILALVIVVRLLMGFLTKSKGKYQYE